MVTLYYSASITILIILSLSLVLFVFICLFLYYTLLLKIGSEPYTTAPINIQ